MPLARRLFPYILLCLALLAATYFALPRVVTSFLGPQLSANLPFAVTDVQITRIGPTQIVANCTFGSEETEALRLSKVIIRYSLRGLLDWKINNITIDTGYVNLVQRGDGFLLPGLKETQLTTEKSSTERVGLLPLAADRIKIQNLQLMVTAADNSTYHLVANAEVKPGLHKARDGYLLSDLHVELNTAGGLSSTTNVQLVSSNQQQTVAIKSHLKGLAPLATLLRGMGITSLAGTVDLNAQFQLENFSKLTSYRANVGFPEFSMQIGDIGIQSMPSQPLQLAVSGTSEELQATVAKVSISGAQEAEISGELKYLFTDSSIVASGQIIPRLLQAPLNFSSQGKIKPGVTELSYTVAGSPLAADLFSVESFSLQGDVTIAGENVQTANQLSIAGLEVVDQQLQIKSIKASIPVTINGGKPAISEPATVTVNDIRRADLNIGNLKATATLAEQTTEFTVSTALGVHPVLNLACHGTAHFTGQLAVDCTMPETSIDSTYFDKSVPFPADSHFSGKVGGTLHLGIENGAPSGTAKLDLTEAQFTSGTNVVSGITTSLTFPHLPLLESGPGQVCTIKGISAGKIHFTDGKISFRMENPETIFIEKSRFSWCSGKVESGGLRLSSATPELHTTLYCDRLNMAELLAQVGLVDTEGDGSLNGRLPLTISKDRIEIEDGFLFSTPGVSGIVHFNNTEQIKEGLPDMGQAAYLDYAVKSLENFSYNWTKLTFNQDQDNLLVTLQLDGAPAEPLPFGYQNGNIVKLDTGRGIQHPIRLDVNFRFPVKDLLKYGKNVQSLMENR